MIKTNLKETLSVYDVTQEIGKIYKGTLLVYGGWKNLIASGVPPLTLLNCKGVDLVDYKIYGNSVQDGTPTPEAPIEVESVGERTRNLISINNYDLTGATLDKVIFDGNLSLPATFSWDIDYIPNNQAALFSFVVDGTTKYVTANTKKFLLKGTTLTRIKIINWSEDVGKITNIQLEEGNIATYYEPYGYKIPVKARGKNLFDINTYGSLLDVTGSPYIDISNFDIGSNFTISTKDKYILKISDYGGATPITQVSGNNATFKVTQAIKDCGHLFIISNKTYNTETLNNLKEQNVQLELGSVATDYEPYIEPITTNIYLNEPLRKVGDYADYIDFKKKKVIRNIGYKKITSITGKSGSSTATFNYYFINFDDAFAQKDNVTVPILSNIGGGTMQEFNKKNKEGIFTNVNTTFFIAFFDITTLAEARQFIQDNNVYANYILKTPTEETIELPNIPTLKGTTILSIENTLNSSYMEVVYKGKGKLYKLDTQTNDILNSILATDTETEIDITDTEINNILDEIIGG